MAITYVSSSTMALSASGTTYTITAPASIADDDLLVLVIAHGRAMAGPAPGWTQVSINQDGSNIGLDVYYRRALASDTSWTFYMSSSHRGGAWCGAYRGNCWVQGGGMTIRTNLVTTQKVHDSVSPQGLRLDLLATWRNSATGCVHAAPAWGTRRAYVDSTDGSTHIELSVVERIATPMTYYSDDWTMTNAPGINPLPGVTHIVDTSQPVDLFDPALAFSGSVAANAGWVYKGRARNTDDAPEVP